MYPAFLVLSLRGLLTLLAEPKARMKTRYHRLLTSGVLISFALDLGFIAWFMVRNHPHQGMYFNSLVGGVKSAMACTIWITGAFRIEKLWST